MTNSNRERKRILLVEDSEDARRIAAFVLEEYALSYARNFDEGVRLARLGYFDLYILDNWLPDRSGVELCRVIRKFDPNTPVLFHSACGYAPDIRKAMRAGAQEYLVKPVSFGDLRQAVARLLSVAREKVFEARRAEIAVIRQELTIRQTENAGRLEKAKQKRQRAEEKALRDMAQIAFIATGGARGDFAREWLSVFSEEVRGAHTSTATGGN